MHSAVCHHFGGHSPLTDCNYVSSQLDPALEDRGAGLAAGSPRLGWCRRIETTAGSGAGNLGAGAAAGGPRLDPTLEDRGAGAHGLDSSGLPAATSGPTCRGRFLNKRRSFNSHCL